jgi:hypothetical protein
MLKNGLIKKEWDKTFRQLCRISYDRPLVARLLPTLFRTYPLVARVNDQAVSLCSCQDFFIVFCY